MDRLPVQKTYKLYIGGKFPRTESDRSLEVAGPSGVAHICHASRKDLRDAVEAARSARAWVRIGGGPWMEARIDRVEGMTDPRSRTRTAFLRATGAAPEPGRWAQARFDVAGPGGAGVATVPASSLVRRGALAGGALGEAVGLRPVLAIGVVVTVVTVGSYASATLLDFEADSPVHREVFGNIPDGFQLELWGPIGVVPNDAEMVENIQAQLAQVGINAELVVIALPVASADLRIEAAAGTKAKCKGLGILRLYLTCPAYRIGVAGNPVMHTGAPFAETNIGVYTR